MEDGNMILVSGGTGVMGARLVRGLAELGWKTRVLTLPNDPFIGADTSGMSTTKSYLKNNS